MSSSSPVGRRRYSHVVAEWVGIAVSVVIGLAALLVGIAALRNDKESNRIAQKALDLAAAQDRRVEFESFNATAKRFGVRNVGNGTAYGVAISGRNTQMDPDSPIDQLLPGEAVTFRAVDIIGAPASPLLTWYREPPSDTVTDPEPYYWRVTLPSNEQPGLGPSQ